MPNFIVNESFKEKIFSYNENLYEGDERLEKAKPVFI